MKNDEMFLVQDDTIVDRARKLSELVLCKPGTRQTDDLGISSAAVSFYVAPYIDSLVLWEQYFLFCVMEMNEPKYAYPYPAQGPPPPVMEPPQYAAPPHKRESTGFLEGFLAAVCCCCCVDQCCCDPSVLCF